ncbi:MAG: hypothetical protein QM539_05820 [Alphaproteobacteria bacterium]|nr:hypothetical protein [Alphaproteobacteria bacterium]
MNKKILVLLFGFLIVTFLSVILYSCCGSPSSPSYFKLESLSWSINNTTFKETKIDGYNRTEIDLQAIINDTVNYNKFSINFTPRLIEYSLHSNNFNLIQSAHACTPPSSSYVFLESIIIESNKQFDSLHPVGSNLADIFDITEYGDYYNNHLTKYKIIGEIQSLVYFNNESIYTYLKRLPQNYVLLLKKMPTITTDYQFTVKLKIHQNYENITDYLEYTTPKIFIKN